MKAYWYTRNKIAFIYGLLLFAIGIAIFVTGKARGIFFHLDSFEARLFASMGILMSFVLMSNIYFNKKDKDIKLPSFLLLLIIIPFFELLAHNIARWIGK